MIAGTFAQDLPTIAPTATYINANGDEETIATGDSYTGSAIITNYTESSPADPDTDTTVGLDLQISGAFTKVTG